MTVRREKEAALIAAFRRIVAGEAQRTEARLTIENVALEAGVSRATAYRCQALAAAIGLHNRAGQGTAPEVEVASERRRSGERELRLAIHQLLSRVTYLEALLAERDKVIAGQRKQLMMQGNARAII